MEEILASIKRVIREEPRAPAPSRSARRAPVVEPDPEPVEEDVLELEDPVSDTPDGSGIASADATIASREALAALSTLRQREAASPLPGTGGPLEAVVRDMLRPMLKDWLDENLPPLVEELVTREIARIVGKQ